MIHLSGLEECKLMIETLADLVHGGILFGVIEGDTVIWRKRSNAFDLDVLNIGFKLDENSTTMKAIRDKKVMIQNISRNVYGKRLKISSLPIIKEDGEMFGALSIAVPLLHPVAASFNNFAPILVEMFIEGAFLYITDLNKVAYRQDSERFQVPIFDIGYELKETDVAYQVIREKRPKSVELDASKFGIPVFVANFPLFDEENENEIVATLGIIMPKQNAVVLREMSGNLENSLSGISSALQQLAASATEIHTNEQTLNDTINEVTGISDEIKSVSAFIKEIADQTKMLGLNASIEAARAGEAGRGFAVVADEIRKLSDQSKSTVPKINKLTDAIKSKVEDASLKSKDSLNASQEQAAATEEITSSIEEITTMSTELGKLALKV
ncbi:methyl-accepting chemotaxis protein [Anaerocolumna sp. MB42-C2]|uniref:methyl-accepting chemotaxis protein n=1 Tax=Anaerocolumna sp. MB42-C2 TaxID=3070997 RepID=UPI0027DFBEBF|nr:methyl-accepting chemotaxis protein [Anaerocolumna sp. MB42-C2]WMJ90408.1 methyl-accepting chemotaxis protein [Anaerocolumna sp. MB42-C2]